MGWFGLGRANVARLARNGDLSRLLAAASSSQEEVDLDGQRWDGAAGTRAAAIRAIGDFGGPIVTETLLRGMQDQYFGVRQAAVETAKRSGAVGTAPALIHGLAVWPEPLYDEMRKLATGALVAWHPPRLPERYALAMTLERPTELRRDRDEPILRAFANADERGADAALRSTADKVLARATDLTFPLVVRRRAAEVFVWVGGWGAEPLHQAVSRSNPNLPAIELAGELRDNRLLEPLVLLCHHPDSSRRAAAATSVGKVQDTRGVAALIRLTQDDVHAVRGSALRALDGFGVSGVVFGVASGAQQPMLNQNSDAEPRAIDSSHSEENDAARP